MSIKIYNGLLFEGTYLELAEKLKQISKQVKEEVKGIVSRIASIDIHLAYDALNAGIEIEKVEEMITPVLDETLNRIKIRKGQSYSFLFKKLCRMHLKEYEFTVVTYPLTDNKILLYPLNEGICIDFTEIEGFKEYGYWDNTDKPECVTEEEWMQRKKDWDTVSEGRFIDGAFSYLLLDHESFCFHQDFDLIPQPIKERRKWLKAYNIDVQKEDLIETPEEFLQLWIS